jgi:glycosyltransferase involved in cell wall biosynthesis
MRPRILFISGRETGYIRNRVLIRALQLHFDILNLSSNARGTAARTLFGLARFVAQRPAYDLCFVGFYGHPLAIALAVLQRAPGVAGEHGQPPRIGMRPPMVFDAYVSTYDTLCEDRQWFRPQSVAGRLARWLDRQSCRAADRVLLDTEAHVRYFVEHLGVPRNKLEAVYVGCDETLFYPRQSRPQKQGDGDTLVFYYGAYLPLHGTEVIVQAAHRLRDRPDIRFVIGGDGPRSAYVRRMAEELDLNNVDFSGWIPLEQLPGAIDRASICLGGHFSTVPKAARVISTKTYQFIAMRRATIVGDNPATRELFTHGEHVYAVPMGDPGALADAIRALTDQAEVRERIAAGGYALYQERLTTEAIGRQLATLITDAMSGTR